MSDTAKPADQSVALGAAAEGTVNRVLARKDIPGFVERKRSEGVAVDVKLLLFMNF